MDPGATIPDDLDEDLREAIHKCREYEAQWTRGADAVHREMFAVLWLHSEPVTWGTMDTCAGFATRKLVRIIDWKFGRYPLFQGTVELQMRSYAAMAMQELGADRAEVRVFQPRTDTELFACYSGPEKIADEILEIIEAAERASPEDLNPCLEACRHCRAKTTCPSFQVSVLDALPAREEARSLAPETMGRALDIAALVGPWIDEVKDQAKAYLVSGGEIPGWALTQRNVRKIRDPLAASEAVSALLTKEEVIRCSKISIGELEDTYSRKAKAQGLASSLKDAKGQLSELLIGVVETETQVNLKRKEN